SGRPRLGAKGLYGRRQRSVHCRGALIRATATARVNRRRCGRVLRPRCHPRMEQSALARDERWLTRERGVREAYAAHGGELYGFAIRSLGDTGLAEEAVQETFLRAWRAGDRYDPEIGSVRTWLFAILRNVIIDLGRARAARPAPSDLEPPERGHEPLEEALVSWQVEEALRRIGEDHRRVLIETHLRGRSDAAAGAERGIPEGTVTSRVYYGLRALRNVLEEMGYDA